MKIDDAPLDLELTSSYKLKAFGQELKPDIRTLEQMYEVMADSASCKKEDPETPLYYMYRHVHLPEHAPLFERAALRYDVTVLATKSLGEEYNKTYGHYHPMHDPNYSYPELYEVLHGTAHYILQERAAPDGMQTRRVFIVKAQAGDKVIVPPNFGHVTVNAGREPLVMDNLVEAYFKSDYAPYKALKGAAYYWKQTDGLEKNSKYSGLQPAVEIEAQRFNERVNKDLAKALSGKKSYARFVEEPSLFEFLTEPELCAFKA